MADPTPEQLAQWKQACAAATPGPWALSPDDDFDDDVAWLVHDANGDTIAAAVEPTDGPLIVISRTALPLLLDAYEQQQAEIGRLKARLWRANTVLGTDDNE